MNTTVHNKLVSFIWSIADDCLRDVYKRKISGRHIAHGCSSSIRCIIRTYKSVSS